MLLCMVLYVIAMILLPTAVKPQRHLHAHLVAPWVMKIVAVFLMLEIKDDIAQQLPAGQIIDQQDIFCGRNAHAAGVRKKALKLTPLKVASICGSVTNVA